MRVEGRRERTDRSDTSPKEEEGGDLTYFTKGIKGQMRGICVCLCTYVYEEMKFIRY